jgi:hypothetical protein
MLQNARRESNFCINISGKVGNKKNILQTEINGRGNPLR